MKIVKPLLLFMIIALSCNVTFGQETVEKATIRSFLQEVLVNKSYKANEIADKYMSFRLFRDSVNTEKSQKERKRLFKKHLKLINKKYSKLYDADSTQIIPYNELDLLHRVPFDKSVRHQIYAVAFRTDNLMYMWVEEQKIKAFDLYIIKGESQEGDAYFIGY